MKGTAEPLSLPFLPSTFFYTEAQTEQEDIQECCPKAEAKSNTKTLKVLSLTIGYKQK